MSGEAWLDLLREVAAAVGGALEGFDGWSAPGERAAQYALDLVADEAALGVLAGAGVSALSEESGLVLAGAGAGAGGGEASGGVGDEFGGAVVIVDPVDGSTNASRRIPYYSVSLCVLSAGASAGGEGAEVSEGEFQVGLVYDLAGGSEWSAIAGEGAWCDGVRLDRAGEEVALGEAMVSVNGVAPGWLVSACAQTRTMGSAALDLCGVASGRFDAFIDPTKSLRVWDYAAGALICQEAGLVVGEMSAGMSGEGSAAGVMSELIHLDPERCLGPLAAAGSRLAAALIADASPDIDTAP